VYTNGNLAIESNPVKRTNQETRKKTVVRKKSIPVAEKLLYLFTVIVCVVVAGAIIWRYSQIYEMNTRIQKIEAQMKQLQIENNRLKMEVSKLQDPKHLLDQAKSFGLLPNDEVNQVMASGSEVAANGGEQEGKTVAMNHKR
jgi:cell division protein FtsL